jgi:4-hydroxy-tetrahydrodipicolinate synthase
MEYDRKDAKQWTRETLHGYMVVTTTPFTADGDVNEAGIRTNIEHYLNLECVTSFYSGSLYTEPFSMSVEERMRVDRVVIDAVAGRVPVMLSASSNSIADSITLARHAQEVGADLCMLWPPQYGHRTRDGVLAFLLEVARSVDIGLCMYSTKLSDMGFYVDAGMLEQLAKEDNIAAVKEASMNPGTYLDTLLRVGESLTVSCPLEENWVLGRQMAGDRYSSPVLLGTSRPLYLETSARPYLSDFYEAAQKKDYDAIGRTLSDILAVAEALHSRYISRGEHNVSIVKSIMDLKGLAGGHVRPPLTASGAEVVLEAQEVLERAGLLDQSR